jgi:hypothetical protein
MFNKLLHFAKHHVATLLLVATVGVVIIQPKPVPAQIRYPPPPTCHRDTRPIEWKRGAYAYYEFAYEKRGRRLAGPCPGGRGLYENIYVYHVQIMVYPHGLVSSGRAEKVCGNVCY